jgi:hypothetical protein
MKGVYTCNCVVTSLMAIFQLVMRVAGARPVRFLPVTISQWDDLRTPRQQSPVWL